MLVNTGSYESLHDDPWSLQSNNYVEVSMLQAAGRVCMDGLEEALMGIAEIRRRSAGVHGA